MNRQMKKMVMGLGILFGLIFLYKAIIKIALYRYMAHQTQVITVSATPVNYTLWQSTISASGSLRPVNGVNVTSELAGMVQKIYFTPGSVVSAGTVLAQLNADAELGQLKSVQAQLALANITYQRDQAQYKAGVLTKQQVDNDKYNIQNLEGQIDALTATIKKKTIYAPFSGRLGISAIYLGQYLNPGDVVVPLQQLDPLYAEFGLPQQDVARIQLGQTVTVTLDAFPNEKFIGKITAINPNVETATRNFRIEATIANPELKLRSGMYVTIEVNIAPPKRELTLPISAVTFNSYGEYVYVVKPLEGTEKDKHPQLIAQQVFIKTGETHNNQIALLEGLKEGDLVITQGQFKLKKGSHIEINNEIMPED